jgi:hypothetical protein
MSDVIGLAKKEIMRKELLDLCAAAGETGIGTKVLRISAAQIGLDENAVEKELYYLQEKGLIRKDHVENKRLGISRDICFITAAGMDYLDGTGEDIPGIGV